MSVSKFGFSSADTNEETPDDLLLTFRPTPINRADSSMEEVDRVAEAAGFASREQSRVAPPTRRRRAVPPEPTRQVAVRMSEALYRRFVQYADKHQLTYQDAIAQLLDEVSADE